MNIFGGSGVDYLLALTVNSFYFMVEVLFWEVGDFDFTSLGSCFE